MSSFMCEIDKDIEFFLQNRAVNFEKLSKSKTYLICDEEQLLNTNGSIKDLIIYGYIALALKVLTVPEETSNRTRLELDGYSAKINNEPISDFACYLIGQLARNDNVPKHSLSGEQLIQISCDIIAASVEAVGGRYIMLDCRDDANLIKFYNDNHFREISRYNDKDKILVQMIRKI